MEREDDGTLLRIYKVHIHHHTDILEQDPNIPKQLKEKIIPKLDKIKGSASITDRACSLWNFIVAQFAPHIQGEEHKVMREK